MSTTRSVERGEPPVTDAPAPRERWLLVAVIGVLVLPLAVGAVRALVDGTPNPGGDQAIFELRVGDVGDDTPVLGSYSRLGANHPGPLWFYLLATPFRLLGQDFAALQVGTLAVGALSLAAMAWIAWARGGRTVLLWTGALLAAFVHALGPGWVADPWEPKGLTLVVAALLFVTFDAVMGRLWSLPAAAVVASILAQAQATLAPFAMTMGVLALGATAVRAVRDREGDPDRRRALAGLAGTTLLVLLLWSPPLVQQLRADPGNLTAFRDAMQASAEPALGGGPAWRAVGLQLGHRPGWLGVDLPLVGFSGEVDAGAGPLVPVGLVALVAAAALAIRRRAFTPVGLAAVVGAGIVVGALSLARLVGPLFVWIPSWTQALGLGAGVATGWCAYEVVGVQGRALVDRAALPVLGGVLVAASGLTVLDARREPATDAIAATVTELAAEVADDLDGTVLVGSDVRATQVFGGTEVGVSTLVLALDDAGVDVVVPAEAANRYGDRRAEPGRATAELRLVDATEPVPDGYRVLATADPVPADERAEREEIAARIPVLEEDGPAALREVERLIDDPELGPLVRRYQALPDLPALRLILREPPP
jgi:hypothetical protein